MSKQTITSTGLIVVGDSDVELWSLSARERTKRAFQRAGAGHIDNSTATQIVLARADYLLGADIVRALVQKPATVLADESRSRIIAINADRDDQANLAEAIENDMRPDDLQLDERYGVVTPSEIGSYYDGMLRKRAQPVARALSEASVDELERLTFAASYKGATDFVTKWCWPVPARSVTRWAAARGIAPNTITTWSLVLVVFATWLFYHGEFLAAIPIAWAMTFLDTVDGKLARVTLTSSSWGNVYDHGIDMIHPPFWWWAWYVGAAEMAQGRSAELLEPALWIILGGYVVGRLFEGVFLAAFKIETHIWRPLDYFFRTITARRNPNLAILTIATVFQRPDTGLILVAAWTVASLTFHAVRIAQATFIRMRGGRIDSYLTTE